MKNKLARIIDRVLVCSACGCYATVIDIKTKKVKCVNGHVGRGTTMTQRAQS